MKRNWPDHIAVGRTIHDGETPVTVRLLQRTVALGSPATCRSTVDAQGREYDLVSITRD